MEESKILSLRYFRLLNISHTLFALPFTIIGFYLGISYKHISFDWKVFVLLLLALIFARNAARTFNKLINKNLTRSVDNSPRISIFLLILYTLLFIACTFFVNSLLFKLSPLALVLIFSYGLAKNSTIFNHFILALNMAFAPVGAYIGVTGEISLLPVMFSIIVFCWISGYDMLYAIINHEFYLEKGIKSISTIYGKPTALWLAVFLHITTGIIVLYAGNYAGFGRWYGIGTIVFIGFLIYQHLVITSDGDKRTNIRFLIVNSFAGIIFSVFTIADIIVNRMN